jgi:hypothetical protein
MFERVKQRAVCEPKKQVIRKVIVFSADTIAGIVTVFCRLQTLYFSELLVKRQWLGRRFVNGVVCIGECFCAWE